MQFKLNNFKVNSADALRSLIGTGICWLRRGPRWWRFWPRLSRTCPRGTRLCRPSSRGLCGVRATGSWLLFRATNFRFLWLSGRSPWRRRFNRGWSGWRVLSRGRSGWGSLSRGWSFGFLWFVGLFIGQFVLLHGFWFWVLCHYRFPFTVDDPMSC